MAQIPRTFERPHLLVVEGVDEEKFLGCMLAQLNIQSVQIHSVNGVSDLSTKIGLVTKTSGFALVERLAILLDSDANPAGRQDSIKAALTKAKLPVPGAPNTLTDGAGLRVMFSTIPSPETVGCLEDLLMQCFATDLKTPCVDNFLDCSGVAPDPLSGRFAKSWIHSMLSTFPEPGKKIGEATNAGYFDMSHGAFTPVRQLLANFVA